MRKITLTALQQAPHLQKNTKTMLSSGDILIRIHQGKTEFLFLCNPDWSYRPWKGTREKGDLMKLIDYMSIKDQYASLETPLTPNEIIKASRIAAELSKNPLYGIPKAEASAIIRKKLDVSKDKGEEKKFSQTARGRLYRKFREDLGVNEKLTDEQRKNGPAIVMVEI